MAEFGSSRRFSDEEDPQSLLDLVDDMDLDLESSDEEAAPFDFEEYVLEHPESYALLHAIPASKLDDYWALFCELDFDGSNEVSASELYESFQVIGIPVDQDELARIIAETDEDGSGEIDFAEFAHMLWAMHQKMLKEPIDGSNALYMVEELETAKKMWQVGREKLWELMEVPSSSWLARIIATAIVIFILVSCTSFVLESLPDLHRRHTEVFFTIEAICVTAFATEYFLRVISTPHIVQFLFEPLSIVDLVAILPFFVELLLVQNDFSGSSILRVVRLVRVFRLFKVSRYMGWLAAVSDTLSESIMPLGMIVFVFTIGVVVYSSAVYYMERGTYDEGVGLYFDENGQESQFQSIPHAFWWCAITMTTVGYGDIVPITAAGKIVASLASLTGVLILAIPISVISANFHTQYGKMMKKRGTAAEHKRSVAEVQAKAVIDADSSEINSTIIKSAMNLLYANSRLMIGNMKHVELGTRTELTNELEHDLPTALVRVARIKQDNVEDVPKAQRVMTSMGGRR